jgi:hypothetical protein
MEKWTIDAIARALAKQMCEEHWGERMDADSGPKRIAVDHLVNQIEANIRSLTAMGAIRPFTTPDGTYTLTRTDSETVFRFVRGNEQSKRDFPEDFAKWKASGLCTLNQAADVMERESGERYEAILERLKESAYTCALPTYEPGSRQPVKYDAGRLVRESDETHWPDLNNWLATTEISFRFTSSGKERRRDELDPAIDKAIELAGTLDLNSVWLKLKELALLEELPFTSECQGSRLAYTNSKNEIGWFSKKALGQRLRERLIRDNHLQPLR